MNSLPNQDHSLPSAAVVRACHPARCAVLTSGLVFLAVMMGFSPVRLAAAPGGSAPQTLVEFSNGDRLRGEIVSIDAKKEVRLRSPDIKEVMEFTTAEISNILLLARQPPSNAAPRYLVQFINDDELLGNITSIDAEQLVLDTWYAGSMRFPRRHVRSIRLQQSDEIIYQGPTGIEGWKVSDTKEGAGGGEAWKYRDGVFYAKEAGAIARDVKLPNMASMDLDVAWRDFLQLTITLYTDSLQVYQLARNVQGPNGAIVNVAAPPQEGAGFYALQLNRNTAYLLTVKKDGQVINSPLDMLPGLENKNKARIGIRVNKEQKSITLLIDGAFVKTWKDADDWAGQGTAVRLVQQGQALVNLSNIRVARWDGTLENAAVPPPNVTKDFVQLRNDDTLSGKLESIREGKLSFTTSFGTLEIPVDRIAQIELPIDPKAKPAREVDSVRAQFAGRGSVTFRLEQWADQQIMANSPNFGKASFNAGAFERIAFKPDNAQQP